MRIAICFLYLFLSILYLSPVADSSRLWGAINIVTQISFIGYLAYELQMVTRGDENLMFQYIKWLSIINCVYITVCLIKDKYWVYHNTGLFAYIAAIGLVVFLVHCALKKI